MILPGFLCDILTRFSAAPAWVQLLTKATLLLAVAWAVHFSLARANPRWRVLLWRGAAVGLLLMGIWIPRLPGLAIRVPAPKPVAADLTAIEPVETNAPALDPPFAAESEPPGYLRSVKGTNEVPVAAVSSTTARRDPVAVHAEAAGPVQPPALPLSWPVALFGVWAFGVALLVVRLATGFAGLKRLLRRSQVVSDELVADVARIAAALGCCRDVQVRSSRQIAVPFICGLRHPVLVLPEQMCLPDYRRQLPGVIAHELGHVASGDFGWNMAMQLAAVLLWFHPLAWLVGSAHRAACDAVCDAIAASYVGDAAAYCRTLAQVALQGAASFTALGMAMARTCNVRRRIALLQQRVFTAALGRQAVAGAMLTGLLASTLLAGLRVAHSAAETAGGKNAEKAAAGLRAPVDSATVPADDHAKLGKVNDLIDTSYMTAGASSIMVLRPAAVFARPEFSQLAKFLEKSGNMVPTGTRLSDFRQITVIEAWRASQPHHFTFPVVMVFQWNEPVAEKYLMAHGTDKVHPVKGYHGKKLYSLFDQNWLYFLYNQSLMALQYDDHTVIAAQSEKSFDEYFAGKRGVLPKWLLAQHWESFRTDHFVFAAETDMIRRTMREIAERSPPVVQDAFLPVSSLWEDSDWFVTGARLGGRFTAHACLGEGTNLMKVWGMAEALRNVAQNAVKKARNSVEANRPPDLATARAYFDLADSLLSNMKIEAKIFNGTVVWLETHVELDSARLRRLSVPSDIAGRIGALAGTLSGAADGAMASRSPSQALRKEADKARSQNNLKILAQAMRKYHDDKGHFPPAVLYGPDGKTPYSWRVAILPYMEYAFLQGTYHFDEPWDGPSNRIVTATILPEFCRPSGLEESPNTAYYALVGPGTIFDNKEGTNSKDITDGTANTILLVEAKRDIPWTKPDDIAYDPGKPLPELGGYSEGGFNVALADGTAQFLPHAAGEKILRALITKAGGEPVKIEDALHARR